MKIMAGAFGLFVIVAMAALIALLSRASRRKVQAIAREWEALARRRGFGYRPARSHPFGVRPPAIEARHGGVEVEATFHLASGGARAATGEATGLSRPAAPFPRPLGLWVGARGLGSLGMGELRPTGDAEFDARFAVAITDPSLVWVIGPELRRALLRLAAAGREPTLTISRGQGYVDDYCRLVLPGIEKDPAGIELAIEAIAAARTSPG